MITETQTETTNGIKTDAQQQIINAIKQDPSLAQVTLRASNDWNGATRSTSRLSGFSMGGQDYPHEETFELVTDLPKPFLGTDQAPTPAEYVLHGLAACMNTTMVYNCAARGFEVRSSSVQIEGDLDARGFLRMDDDIEARYKGVRVEFKVDSDGDPEVIEDLIKGSSMYNVFTTPIPIELTFA